MENDKQFKPRQDAELLETKRAEKSLGYGEKQRIDIRRVSDQKEDWRDWLRSIAEQAGVDVKAHLGWVEAHFDMADIALSQQSQNNLASGWLRDGAPVELAYKLAVTSNEALAEWAARWKRFAQTILATSLRHMEDRGDTAEEEMDVLTRALWPVQDRLRSRAGELMLAARARMAQRPDQQDGYYQTRGALADILAGLKDELSQRRRCYLYWEILVELQSMGTQQVSPGTWASIINADANNLAVTLNQLHISHSVEFMKLSVVAGSAARKLGEDDLAEDVAKTGLIHFFGEAVTPEWAAILNDMCNVPTAWKMANDDATDVNVLLVEMSAAVARAGLKKLEGGPRKVANALFNAGVTVSRGVKFGGNWIQPRQCQIVLNGAGLLWALSQSPEGNEPADYLTAMAENRGGGCAVNLMGTLAEFHRDSRDALNEPLSRFVGALYGLKQAISSEDIARIEAAVKKMKISPTSVTGNPVVALNNLLRACLRNESNVSWLTTWEAFAKVPSPDTLGALLTQTGKQGHQAFPLALSQLAGLLGTFETQAHQWPDAFMEAPIKEWIPEWHAEIEAEWRGMLNGPRFPDRLAAMANDLIYG